MRILILSSLFVKLNRSRITNAKLVSWIQHRCLFLFCNIIWIKDLRFSYDKYLSDHNRSYKLQSNSSWKQKLRCIFAVSYNNRMDRISYSLVLKLRTMQTPDKTVWLHSMMLANGLQSANFDDKYSSNWMNFALFVFCKTLYLRVSRRKLFEIILISLHHDLQ